MSLGIQTIIVIAIVAACASMIGHQCYKALRGKPSKIGSCCAKGCSANAPKPDTAAPLQFLPADTLRRRKQSAIPPLGQERGRS